MTQLRRDSLSEEFHFHRQEVAKQLAKIQKEGVIQPSSSPSASAVVLVRKKNAACVSVSITVSSAP